MTRRQHYLMWLLLPGLLAVCAFVLVSRNAERDPVVFINDAEAFTKFIRLNGPSVSSGDVLWLGDRYLCVRELRPVYRFTQNASGDLELDGRLISVKDACPSPDVASGLWGFTLKEGALPAGLDPARTFLYFERIPVSIPQEARYVRIDGPEECRLPAGLVYLNRLATGQKFDARALSGLSNLVYLHLYANELEHLETLQSLPKLRTLSLVGCTRFKDTRLLAGLRELRILELDGTPVEDLRPLAALPHLEEVTACVSRVRFLPRSVSWRHLILMDSEVSPQETAAFRSASPWCRVWSLWEEPLRERLSSANRIVVSSDAKTSSEERDSAEVQRLIAGLSFRDERGRDEWHSGYDLCVLIAEREELYGMNCCLCTDSPTLEFYSGSSLLASLTNQHGCGLRWVGGPWPGDGSLTGESAEHFGQWLAARGFPHPLEEGKKYR